MKKLPVYAVPGLGVDGRIFGQLDLGRPMHILEWLEPYPLENMADYAHRMAETIPQAPYFLMGLSFGGVICQLIALEKPPVGILLVSSVRYPGDLPWTSSLMKRIPFYKLSKGNWRISTLPLWAPIFGIHKKAEQALLISMFRKFSYHYRQWAVQSLIHWEGSPVNQPILQIHGSHDKVLPYPGREEILKIEKGNHFMIYQKAKEISKIIRNQCEIWEADAG